MNRHKSLILTISIIVIALTILATLTVVLTRRSYTCSLYFLDTETKSKLVVEQRKVKIESGTEGLITLVELLISGPQNVDAVNAIPPKTTVISLVQEHDVVTVNFSREYHGPTIAEDLLAASTVVNTLCERSGVSKVVILVDGQELMPSQNNALNSTDIVVEGAKNNPDNIDITVYIPNASGAGLVAEHRSILQKNKEPLAKLAIAELIKEPENKSAARLIPAEAKLLSVETKANVCFVNFSKEFTEKHVAGGVSELLCIYSIVNTVTSIGDIDRVQFLVDGKKVNSFGGVAIDEPLKADLELIQQ